MTELRVGGLARLSTCDWPDELVATVFCQGCPWDCPYCHNPHLQPARGTGGLSWPAVLAFLEGRRGLLDGVVFSGGEPTAQRALPEALGAVRAMGFAVGLHTAGPFPDRLAAVLPLVDWVGLDVKAPFDRYDRLTGVPGSGERARQSLHHVLSTGGRYEIRTTVHPDLLSGEDLRRLTGQLSALGVRHYALQAFRPHGTVTGNLRPITPDGLPRDGAALFEDFRVR